MTLSLTEFIGVAAVFLLAGAVKGVIGLGLPTIAMGLLGAVMPPTQAAAILVIPTVLTNVWQMWNGPALKALMRRLWPMLGCTVVATVMAAGVITHVNARLTTALLGLVLIVYAVTSLSGWRFMVSGRAEPLLGPLVGLTTGIINGATAIFVLPAVPYMQAIKLDRDELVQAFALSAFVSAVALALGLGVNRGFGAAVVAPASVALATALAGMAVGQVLRSKLSVEAFRYWVLIGLLALGCTMIARSLF